MRPGKNNIGYMVGGFTNYKINKKIINQFELNLIQKGHKSTYYNSNNTMISQWKILQTYIEPTILFKYNIWGNLFIGSGLSLGYLTKTRLVENFGSVSLEIQNLSFTKFDKSLLLELSYVLSTQTEMNLRLLGSIVSTTFQDKKSFWYVLEHSNHKGTFNEVIGLNINYTINKKKN